MFRECEPRPYAVAALPSGGRGGGGGGGGGVRAGDVVGVRLPRGAALVVVRRCRLNTSG